jgi:hypothetical protein
MLPSGLRLLLVLSSLTLVAAPATAQEPSDRAALDRLRDSLSNPDQAALVQPSGAWARDDAVGLVGQALILLHQGEQGESRQPYDAALRRVERALDARSDWPYPWYALGIVRLAMSERGFVVKETPYHPSGTSYRRAAMDAFARAISAEAGFSPAADALAGLVVALGHRLLSRDFVAPLRLAAAAQVDSPVLHLALYRLDYGGARYETARVDIAAYLRSGGDSGLARLEDARALQALGDSAAAVESYLSGLRLAGPAGRAEYRDDFSWIATESELARFDSLPAAAVARWGSQFWLERDALALRRPGERVAEHLRRWAYVHRNYLIHRPEDAPIHAEGITADEERTSGGNLGVIEAMVLNDLSFTTPKFKVYRRRQWEIDDRGVIYLRHGPPTRTAFYPPGPPNLSWQYDLPEGSRVFHFLGSRALGTTAATTLVAALPLEPGMLDSRGNLDPMYTQIASDLQRKLAQMRTLVTTPNSGIDTSGYYASRPGSAAASVAVATLLQPQGGGPRGSLPPSPTTFRPEVAYREIQRGRAAIAAGVTTDGFPQHFSHDLGAIVQSYGVGLGPGQHGRILTVFAVPGRDLTPRPRRDGGPGLLYPVALRVVALDRTGGIIRQLDTVRTFLSRDTLRKQQHLTGLIELPVPPGLYQVRTLVTSPGVDAATAAGRDSVAIPPEPEPLALSDLILGREGTGLVWSYAGEQVRLNPLNAYPKGTDADLFYEIGGLVPGETYSVSIAVRRARDKADAKPAFQVGFELTAEGPYQRVTRNLGLANLKPDSYLLVVAVNETGSSREVIRVQALNILDSR